MQDLEVAVTRAALAAGRRNFCYVREPVFRDRKGALRRASCDPPTDIFQDPPVRLFPTGDGRGYGIMASSVLKRGAYLAEYCAEVRDVRHPPRGPASYVSIANIQGRHNLDCWQFSNWAAWINHGDPPAANVVASSFGSHGSRVAIHVGDVDIQPSSELLLCYAPGVTAYFEECATRTAGARRKAV